MKQHRRGLTLIEIVTATVLLTVMAAICAPLLRNAVALSTRDRPSVDLDALSILADEVVRDSQSFGLESLNEPYGTEIEISWPDSLREDLELDTSVPPVHLEIVRSDGGEEELNHVWVLFTCGPFSIARWIRTEEEYTR